MERNFLDEASYVYIDIRPGDTNYVNRILEGYEYLGVMTTLDADGRCVIRSTPDTKDDVVAVLRSLDIPLRILG